MLYLESIITPSRVHVTEELGQPLNENIDDLSENVKKKVEAELAQPSEITVVVFCLN